MTKPFTRALMFALPALLLWALCVSSPLFSALSSPPSEPAARPKIYSIAFVRFKSTNLEKSKTFYSAILGLRPSSAECRGASDPCFRVGETQQVQLIDGPSDSASAFLEVIALRVENAEGMRAYLTSHGIACSKVAPGPNGLPFVAASDPEGHSLVFVEPLMISGGPDQVTASSQPSARMIHAGIVVRKRGVEDEFYRELLGFRLYWHGGMKTGTDDWVDMQVPDGTDWIEYMLNVSPNASHKTLGVMNHIALGVPDIHAAQQQLIKNGWKGTEKPQIGRDGKWQLNLYDPDETRVELMEFTPVEKPCCSEYTGPHPKP